jgi:hypothetical protein
MNNSDAAKRLKEIGMGLINSEHKYGAEVWRIADELSMDPQPSKHVPSIAENVIQIRDDVSGLKRMLEEGAPVPQPPAGECVDEEARGLVNALRAEVDDVLEWVGGHTVKAEQLRKDVDELRKTVLDMLLRFREFREEVEPSNIPAKTTAEKDDKANADSKARNWRILQTFALCNGFSPPDRVRFEACGGDLRLYAATANQEFRDSLLEALGDSKSEPTLLPHDDPAIPEYLRLARERFNRAYRKMFPEKFAGSADVSDGAIGSPPLFLDRNGTPCCEGDKLMDPDQPGVTLTITGGKRVIECPVGRGFSDKGNWVLWERGGK